MENTTATVYQFVTDWIHHHYGGRIRAIVIILVYTTKIILPCKC